MISSGRNAYITYVVKPKLKKSAFKSFAKSHICFLSHKLSIDFASFRKIYFREKISRKSLRNTKEKFREISHFFAKVFLCWKPQLRLKDLNSRHRFYNSNILDLTSYFLFLKSLLGKTQYFLEHSFE